MSAMNPCAKVNQETPSLNTIFWNGSDVISPTQGELSQLIRRCAAGIALTLIRSPLRAGTADRPHDPANSPFRGEPAAPPKRSLFLWKRVRVRVRSTGIETAEFAPGTRRQAAPARSSRSLPFDDRDFRLAGGEGLSASESVSRGVTERNFAIINGRCFRR